MFSSATGKTKFGIRDTKHYVPVATLLTQDNSKVLEQLKNFNSNSKAISVFPNWSKFSRSK